MSKGINAATAIIEKENVVIRVPIESLPFAFQTAVDMGYIKPGFKITNAKEFAKDLIHALNDEDEDGGTPIHRLFDQACEAAIEQGAFGVEEVDDE